MNEFTSKEEIREFYKKMPIEEFLKLYHKELRGYAQEYTEVAKELIREVAKERKKEIDSYYFNEQKEFSMAKEKWDEIRRKYSILKATGYSGVLDERYDELEHDVSSFLNESRRESDAFKDFELVFGDIFDLATIDDFISKLKEFDTILDKKLVKKK